VLGGNGKRQDKFLCWNDLNARQCQKRQRNSRPGKVTASKIRQSNTGQEEMHRKAANEREQGSQFSGVIRNQVKPRVSSDAYREEQAIEGKGL
jgi:hypothetical protein